ncbi:ATP-binding protein [Fulvivirga ligni]|uniref:ATP-binding protein n=1 Tax=Fulvivirga ligni TaxID=2904246 RepID=UPI001F3E4730|nr:tetratricopeptide repeat protein [Fulvivirga ligni]UII23290.1 tetratricopeptide repeat-containing sensor histidine kinase [Fulvivirga ligni]
MKSQFSLYFLIFISLSFVKAQDSSKLPYSAFLGGDIEEKLVFNYFDSIQHNLDSAAAFSIYNDIQQHRSAKNWPLLHCNILKAKGDYFHSKDNFVEAIRNYRIAASISQKHQYDFTYAVMLFNIARVYDAIDKKPEALKAELEAYSIFIKTDSAYSYKSVNHITNLEYRSKNFREAIIYGNKAIKILNALPDNKRKIENSINTLNSIGISHRDIGNYDSAIHYLNKSRSLANNNGFEFWEALTAGNLGLIYKSLGEPEKAIPLLKKDYLISRKHKQTLSAINAAFSLGEIYQQDNDFSTAKLYYDTVAVLIDNIGRSPLKIRMKYSQHLSSWFGAQKQFENAYAYQQLFQQQSDSLKEEQLRIKLTEIKALHDFETKVTEIDLLTKNSQIQQQQIKNQNLIIIGSIVAIILIMIIAFLFYRQLRLKKREHVILEKNKNQIEAQNMELEAQSEQLSEQNKVIQHINTNLEEEVEKRTLKLKKLNEELDTFIYRSSHDIRQPIATILGLENLARNYTSDPNLAEVLIKIKETALNMDNMLWKLQMSYLLNHDHTHKTELELQPLITVILKLYEEHIQKYNIDIQANIGAISLVTSPELIRIIIRNIIENAIYFSDEDTPKVIITTEETAKSYLVKIYDNGNGINPRQKSEIYKAFYKASTKSKGNGLGLYLAAKAADLLDIDLQVDSSAEKGTTFSIFIPKD